MLMAALRSHWPLAVILFFYAVILVCFPMRMQAMESYAYAAGVDGYYNLSQTFALLTPGKALPDISLYHPNHPLAHLLPGMLHQAFGFDAMTIFRVRNGLCALGFAFFFYLAAARLVIQRAAVIWATIMVICTYVFWSSALSGETQIPALAFIMATTYFLLRHFEPESPGRPGFLISAVCCYIVAGGCHVSVVMFSIPAGLAVLVHSRSRKKWALYLLLLFAIIAGYVFFYVLLFVHFLKIESLDMYLRTLFIYYPILVRQYTSPEWWLATGKSLLLSVSYSETVLGGAGRVGAILVIALGYAAVWRAQVSRSVKFLLFAWPVSQMIIQVIVNGRPDGTNFWLFLLPPFYLAAAFGFRRLNALLRGKLVLAFIVAAVGIGNFMAFVWPNTSLQKNEFIYIENHLQFGGNPPLAIVVSNPVLTFPELWWAGSHLGLKQQKVFFPCCGEADVADHLRLWAGGQRAFFLMSDEEAVGISREFVSSGAFRCSVLQESKGELRSAVIPVTVSVDYPPDGLVRKNLRLYYCEK